MSNWTSQGITMTHLENPKILLLGVPSMWLKLDFLNYFTSTVSHPISNVYFASQSIHHRHPYYFNESFRKILIANSWKKPRNVWWLSNIVKLTLVYKLQMQWINIFYVNKRIKLHISPNHKVCPFEKTQYKSTVLKLVVNQWVV